MKERTDQQWLEELRGDGIIQVEAYTDLYHLLFQKLYGFIRERRRNIPALDGLHPDEIEELAADYAQDSLLRIWQRLDSYNGTGRFMSWAFVIAVNVVREAFRRKRWSVEIFANGLGSGRFAGEEIENDVTVDPNKHALLQSMLDDLAEIIENRLTQREQTSFILHYLCSWKSKEIAWYLHAMTDSADPAATTEPSKPKVTANAVNRTLHRTRKKIALALIEAGYELEDVVDLPSIAWESVDVPNFKCPEAPSA